MYLEIDVSLHRSWKYIYYNPAELESGSITTLKSEVQMSFIEAAMAYVVDRNWTYYIGGSNYNLQVTPFRYCSLPNNAGNPGKFIQISIF